MECGSKRLGGCDFPHGENHIFLASCDCRVVSLTDRLARPLLVGGVSEWELRTLAVHAESGADIKLTHAMFEHIAGRGGTTETTKKLHLLRIKCAQDAGHFLFDGFSHDRDRRSRVHPSGKRLRVIR